MKNIIVLLAFLVVAFTDDVTLTWGGGCSGGATGITLTWAATNAEGAFKPDGKNGAMVPCDEFFESCFSFVDANGDVIVLPQISSGNFYNFVAGYFNVTPGVITSTVVPEDPGFGSGYISTVGATYLATGQAFTVTCTNNIPNFKVRSNYFLDATNNPGTNPNYVRALNTITDSGPMGFGGVVAPYNNPPASFNIGQSMCNSAAQTPIPFPFPAYGTALPGAAPITQGTPAPAVTNTDTNNVVTTAANTPVTPPVTPITPNTPVTPIVQAASQQGGGNALSGGAVAGIVIAILIVAGVLAGVAFVFYRRRAMSYPNDMSLHRAEVPTAAPVFVNKPLPASPASLFVGMSIMARYSGDGREYRAVILQIQPGPQYLVQYVDFGSDKEWLPATSVRPL